MEMRTGSSCALTIPMAIGDVVETRELRDGDKEYAKWKEVSKYSIDNKKYLILTPCTNNSSNQTAIPSIADWKKMIENECKYLISIGGNYKNCHISQINEGTKWFRDSGGKERWVQYINAGTEVIHKYGLISGAGNLEFYDAAVLGDWYGYLCVHGEFDIIDSHVQGSCDTEERIKKYVKYAFDLAKQYKKRLNCTEAFYGDIRTDTGWKLLNLQRYYCGLYEFENFCNVFNNLDYIAFPPSFHPTVNGWRRLSFLVNNVPNSPYWDEWKHIMDTTGPVPNVEEGIFMLKEVYKNGMKDEAGIHFIQMVLNEDIKPTPPLKVDGWWGDKTNPIVLQYQAKYSLNSYNGEVGPNTFQHMIKTYPAIWDRFDYLRQIRKIL